MAKLTSTGMSPLVERAAGSHGRALVGIHLPHGTAASSPSSPCTSLETAETGDASYGFLLAQRWVQIYPKQEENKTVQQPQTLPAG